MTKIIVNGARGKMGVLACAAIRGEPGLELVAELGREDNLAASIEKTNAEVVVDLTRADCVYENSLTIISSGAYPVIGSSGLQDDQIANLKKLCEEKNLGGVIAPNFSIGACLMMRFAAEAAAFFPEVEIIEAHHQQKLDAPSGTSLKTAEMIAAARTAKKNNLPLKELLTGARGATLNDIHIHSIRLPGFLAQQQVVFGGAGESLSITHNTLDRASFMPGIIFACRRVQTLKSLYYGLEHLLFAGA